MTISGGKLLYNLKMQKHLNWSKNRLHLHYVKHVFLGDFGLKFDLDVKFFL